MSLHNLAEHIRAQGRGEDTMLIHMTPKEVAGLQALAVHHGGSLTINPKTGLPEAGFLSKILPILAGVGLSFIPGVGPLAAAGITAGVGTLATGSLSKGLMMGLGAFGGAGLAGGIANMGLGALAGEGGAALAGSAAEAATANAASAAFPSSANLAASSAGNIASAARTAATTGNAAADMALSQKALPQTFMGNASNFGANLTKAVQNPSQFMQATGGPMKTAMYGSAAVAPFALDPNMKYKMPGSDQGEDDNGAQMPSLSSDFYSRPMYSGSPNPVQYPYRTHFRSGGIAALNSYKAGGKLIMGPGDGMSDSIKARMSNGREARLTDGEFVVPSDVVSGIGNGSSRAGAQMLYDMMDRVRVARTGTTKQPEAAPMHRMMPA